MSRRITMVAVIALYAIGSVVTFGYAAAAADRWQIAHCATPAERLNAGGTSCYSAPSSKAIPAAFAWPLYWSWEAFA